MSDEARPDRSGRPEVGVAYDWDLVLYVNGASPHSTAAVDSVRRLCDEELPGRSQLQIIDVQASPTSVRSDQVVAAPTLVKRFPLPVRKLVGDLTDLERVRSTFGLPHRGAGPDVGANRAAEGGP